MNASQQNIPTIQKFIAVLWPSFLTAGIATILFFTAFDPQLLMALGGYEQISRLGGYTIDWIFLILVFNCKHLRVNLLFSTTLSAPKKA